jgi:peroxiredoxin
MKRKTNLIIWAVAGILVIAAAYTFYSKNKSMQFVVPPETSAASQTSDGTKVMAPDFSLKDLSGNTVKLSDYKGKVVILNFWAVWCRYCKEEMPDLNELNKELAKDNNAVILAVDAQESADTVKNYLSANNIDLKVLLDSDGAITQKYGISGFPTTFIVNKDGSLYTYISGKTDKATLNDILDKIKSDK